MRYKGESDILGEGNGLQHPGAMEANRPVGLITKNLIYLFSCLMGFPSGSVGKNPLAMQEMQAGSLSLEDLLEGELAIYSSILTWKIPWTEKPGGL